MRRLGILLAIAATACSKPAPLSGTPSGPLLSAFEPAGSGCRWVQVIPGVGERPLCRLPVTCTYAGVTYSDGGVALGHAAGTTALCVVASSSAEAVEIEAPLLPTDVGFVFEDPAVVVSSWSPSPLRRFAEKVGITARNGTDTTLAWTNGAWHPQTPLSMSGLPLYGRSGDYGRAVFEKPSGEEATLLARLAPAGIRDGWVRIPSAWFPSYLRGVPGSDLSAAGPLVVLDRGVARVLKDSQVEHVEPEIRDKYLLYSGASPRLYDLESGELLYESDTAVGVTFWR